ncbi:MAG: hypothetical protein L0G39_20010 [Chryseobacterium sp.]|nr:hypothetical protein [Chryseobacterium sp.]
MKDEHDDLFTKTNVQVLKLMREKFNFYTSNSWTYIRETGGFYRKTGMFIFFESENVSTIEIRKMYGKVRT